MRGKKIKSKTSIIKYLPVLLILLSITIMVGSTFAYFTDRKDTNSDLTFSKVELSSETTLGINGELRDVIPGSKIVDGAVAFSKAIDSEAIYVRAKVSFTLPEEYEDDADMQALIKRLRDATDFNININEQSGGAVWSEKQGNYFYLVTKADNTKLMRVDTIDTYTLSNEIVIPRDLEQLEDNKQYMKSINFHIAFEAIQADNVSDTLVETEEIFNEIFPESVTEKTTITVNILDENFNTFSSMELNEPQFIDIPTLTLPKNENGTSLKALDGWYLEKECVNEFNFDNEITADLTLYPKVINVSEGLEFTEIYGTSTISNSPDFKQSNANGNDIVGYSVADGTCTDSVIVVPKYYLNKPVIEVKNHAFYDNNVVEKIILPDTITIINNDAFHFCESLVSVNLPNGVKEIGVFAFKSCTSLQYLKIPESVESIGASAFRACPVLEEINIPKNCVSIGAALFTAGSSPGVKKITVSKENPVYYDGGGNCIIETETKTLIAGCNYSTIPDGVVSIAENAFYGCDKLNLNSFPESLTYISQGAFYDCESMELSSLPNSINNIESNAFYNCENITLTDLPKTLTVINSGVFSGCTNLQLSELHEEVTQISASAFFGCSNITIAKLPDNLQSLGSSAFKGCKNITISELPNGLTSIGQSTFENCTNITLSELSDDITTIGASAFYNCPRITFTKLPSSLTSIGANAFYNCVNIRYLTLPSTLKTISSNAFQGCVNLIEVINLSSLNITKSTSNGYVGYYALNIVSNLDESKISKDNDYVYYAGGEGATYLLKYEGNSTVLNLPEDYNGFEYIISNHIFYGNKNIVKVVISEGTLSIGTHAFYECINLKEINIVESIASIGNYAFYKCTKLEIVDFNAIEITDFVSNNAIFSYAGQEGKGITLTIGSKVTKLPAYFFYPESSNFRDPKLQKVIFEDGSECVSIGAYAFYNCRELTSFTIPSLVTTIGNGSFRNCYALIEVINLSELTLEKGKDTNGYIACYAVNITNINGSNMDNTIEDFEFYNGGEGNIYLTRYLGNNSVVVLPDNYNGYSYKISSNVFYENLTISSITIPENVTGLGVYAFFRCKNLVEINFNSIYMDDLPSANFTFYEAGANTDGITVNIGANVTRIPSNMFNPTSYFTTEYIPKITKVVFAENSKCESIGDYAFLNSVHLLNLTIPSLVNNIGVNPFAGCINLNLLVKNSNTAYYMDNGCLIENTTKKLVSGFNTSTAIPNDVLIIGEYAFFNCSNFTNGSMSNFATTIGQYAFYGCTSLLNIGSIDSVNSIGTYAFYGCKSLLSITIPRGVKNLPVYAFAGCTSLVEINFKAETIADFAKSNSIFANAGTGGIGVILNIGKYVTKLPKYFFYQAGANIIQVIFEEGSVCGSIGANAFYNTKIRSINMPTTVTRIYEYAFYSCYDLDSIYLHSGILSIGTNAIPTSTIDYILCETLAVANLFNSYGRPYTYIQDTTTDFTNIEFVEISKGAVNGTYNDGTNYYVRTGEEGSYVYYKKYTA